MKLLLCTLLLLLAALPLSAQVYPQSGYQPAPLGKDKICFRYQFNLGDTLYYTVHVLDSVKGAAKPVLQKDRTERLMLYCDSVDKRRGIYRLRQRLLSSKSIETSDTTKTTRSSSPWIGRTSTLYIDTLGRRLFASIDDTTRIALNTGGPLQPWLVVDIGQSCGRQNESWLREDSTLLPENGAPEPAYRYQSLFRVLDNVDTLGRHFNQLQYAQSGIGAFDVDVNGTSMHYMGTVNSYGKLTMDRALRVPYHLFATTEIVYTITVGNGGKEEGKHLILMHFSLDELRSKDPRRRFQVRKS